MQAWMHNSRLKKRRRYSKLGCVECKRRKVKCDETKPVCWQCSHLEKECNYKGNNKLAGFKEFRNYSFDTDLPTKGSETEAEEKFGTITPQDLDLIMNEASLLANDIFISMTDPLVNEQLHELSPLDITQEEFHRFDKWATISTALQKESPIDLYYLKVFYNQVSFWLMPLAVSPDDNICNEILFHQITTAAAPNGFSTSYLQSAMISLGAKFKFNTTGLPEHNVIRKRYLKISFAQLHEVFKSPSRDSLIVQKVESLILCVLLFTLDSSSYKSQEWQMHLKGAKDLFLKCQAMGLDNESSEMRSKSLALAKSWFSAIEASASVSRTGSLKSDAEIEEMYSLGAYDKHAVVLQEMGILTADGFNVFLGYSTEAICLLKEVIKCNSDKSFVDKYNDKLLLISTLVQASREYHFLPNEFGVVTGMENDALEGKMQSSYIRDGPKAYSVFDTVHQAHADAIYLIYLIRNVHLPISSSIIQGNCERIIRNISWIFRSDTDVEMASGVIKKVADGEITDYAAFLSLQPDLIDRCLIKPIVNDFRIMMIHLSVVLCGLYFRPDNMRDLACVRTRICAYFQCLAQNLGADSGKVSLEFLFKRWRVNELSDEQEQDDEFKDYDALPFS
ncbi:LAMI_0D07580g1_1 [Lachancea mirantina]|uniref:LAMI_0D07580g1_1 n=1 Tax=Lachancea mirantina TaxID=1230905 RepID=A0A1G4JCF0_9SACH|nr:LAMI_0D07580g1_1 [Lachancea mirantina]